jgi:hypothetical protein
VLMLGTPPPGVPLRQGSALYGHHSVSLAPSALPIPHALGPGDTAAALLTPQPERTFAPTLASWPRSFATPVRAGAGPPPPSGPHQNQQQHLAWAWGQLEGSLSVGLSRVLTPGGGAPDSTWGLLHCLLRLCDSSAPGGPPHVEPGSLDAPASASAAAIAALALVSASGNAGGNAVSLLADYKRGVLRPAADLELWVHSRGFVCDASAGLHDLASLVSEGAASLPPPQQRSNLSDLSAPGPEAAEGSTLHSGMGVVQLQKQLLRPLAAALADAEGLYAHKLRVTVLAAARGICLLDYSNSVVVRAVDESAAVDHAMNVLLRQLDGGTVSDSQTPAPVGAGSIAETLVGWATGLAPAPEVAAASRTLQGTASVLPSQEDSDSIDFPSMLFRLPTCQVSTVAQQLVLLAHHAMEAAEASTRQGGDLSLHTAWVLFRSAKDALALFASVIPLRCGPSFSTSPRLAMLFHNDCLFLAHHCILLSWRHSGMLLPLEAPSAVSTAEPAPVSFADLLPMLRSMAQRALVGQVCVPRGVGEGQDWGNFEWGVNHTFGRLHPVYVFPGSFLQTSTLSCSRRSVRRTLLLRLPFPRRPEAGLLLTPRKMPRS